MDFTAIDFETASHRRDSACQLAAVIVRDGKVVDSVCWLIRPEPMRFTASNIRIHGITPEQVCGEPTFGELWPEIADKLVGDCLVAHNASFDLGVLLACLQAHGHPVPEMQFTCTRAIARKTWPGRRSYGLKPLADWLGVRFRHHDALEDSLACSKVLLAARLAKQASTLESLEQSLGLTRGVAGNWGFRGPAAGGRRRSAGTGRSAETRQRAPGNLGQPAREFGISAREVATDRTDATPTPSLDLQRLLIRGEFIRPLAGQRVVFTGTFRTFTRNFAETLAVRLGGECQASVTSETNLLVVGTPDQRTQTAGRTQSVKEQRACQLREAGKRIQLLDEEAFLKLLDSHPSPS